MKHEITKRSRLKVARLDKITWRKWGSYLNESLWAKMREDNCDRVERVIESDDKMDAKMFLKTGKKPLGFLEEARA